jgi:drug/metabolite transporter (DMT)-like permease
MLLAFYNITQFGATASAMTAYIIPGFAGIGGALLLNEHITPFMLLGMGLIMIGIAPINPKRK